MNFSHENFVVNNRKHMPESNDFNGSETNDEPRRHVNLHRFRSAQLCRFVKAGSAHARVLFCLFWWRFAWRLGSALLVCCEMNHRRSNKQLISYRRGLSNCVTKRYLGGCKLLRTVYLGQYAKKGQIRRIRSLLKIVGFATFRNYVSFKVTRRYFLHLMML